MMDIDWLKETIRRELPALIHSDAAFRSAILELAQQQFPTREESDRRFDRMLDELRQQREAQEQKWAEQDKKWEALRLEDNRKWEEQNKKWEELRLEDNKKWEEQNKKWAELRLEDNKKSAEQSQLWHDNNTRFEEMHKAMLAESGRLERHLGALGSRWGTQSEKAFRDALAGILETSFGVQVLNINDYDESGEVFGRPDQVELDVIIQNGLLLICELKSSMDKASMYSFERKARFYEKRHHRQANRLIVISPMIDARARKVGQALGIEMYGDSLDVPLTYPE